MNNWMICWKFDAKIVFSKGIEHLNFWKDLLFYQDNYQSVLDFYLYENARHSVRF